MISWEWWLKYEHKTPTIQWQDDPCWLRRISAKSSVKINTLLRKKKLLNCVGILRRVVVGRSYGNFNEYI